MKKRKIRTIIGTIVIIVAIILILIINVFSKNSSELKSISSQRELKSFYNNDSTISDISTIFKGLMIPFAIPYYMCNLPFSGYSDVVYSTAKFDSSSDLAINSFDSIQTLGTTSSSSSKDYSTTNIQVENVDEADVTKTDGDYIYSISEKNVVITNVKDPSDIRIVAEMYMEDEYPEDLILYKDKLVVISTAESSNVTYSYYRYNSKSDTVVTIYDIKDRENPEEVKKYTLYEDYYTSRCINNKLYVISSGNLREDDDDNIITSYKENNSDKEIKLSDIKYLKDVRTDKQTLISYVDLDDAKQDVSVNSYLIDISNAYVSENNIYLLDYDYDYENELSLKQIYGLKGIFGLYDNSNNDYDSTIKTKIYKFNILDNGKIKYDTKTTVDGKTINQFSIDEYKENLRVALSDSNGSRIVVFDKRLNKIGETESLAKGEKMYSSRFLGDKAYLVTYKTVDPLFVIDLSNPSKPTVLGKLKIPGYSTYLHPYDENHLIGIGMETEETVNRDSFGKVTSTTARITGMKMALFDVSDVNNPIQISNTVIGDSRATSAILTNHKALLFSKEKELLAIPVNNYEDDFAIETSSEDYDDISNLYINYGKEYISEGYFVYNLNIKDGFKLKGVINHDLDTNYYGYNTKSNMLRGLYIDDNLYTVSETAIKVNKLDNLEQVDEIDIINYNDTEKANYFLDKYLNEEDE